MSKKTLVAVLVTVAGAIITLALLRAAAPLDGGTAPALGADSQPTFGPGMFLAPQVLEIADADADGRLSPEEAAKTAENLVRQTDSEKKGSIDAAALGRAINRRLGPRDGGPGGPADGSGGPPGGGPGGFGPGKFLGPRILEAADVDKDGRLSPEEAASGAARFVRAADTTKKGSLDERTLAESINQHIGPPPGSGPGGPMGEERKLLK
jgi:EF hand